MKHTWHCITKRAQSAFASIALAVLSAPPTWSSNAQTEVERTPARAPARSGLSIQEGSRKAVDATSLQGKVLCGYQGWFRCAGDATGLGWIHWSHDAKHIAPDTLAVEMWPDMREYGADERYPVPGFTHADGRQAYLFSSDHPRTVLRHFEWMRAYGIDGVWLQHFLVDLPGGLPENQNRYESRLRVLDHFRKAANRTGRVWALSYDIAGMPTGRIFEALTRDWKRMVAAGITRDPRYLHHDGRPAVMIWGFYYNNPHNRMTAELANQLIDFFKTPGSTSAVLVGGGNWNWRRNPDPQWQAFYRRFDAYAPWNIGNYWPDQDGVKHATTSYWADDKRECKRHGTLWIPVVYPGFSWDNLQRRAPGTTNIPRRGGRFLWEQFSELARLRVDCVYVAMFDEVDEGTAIFKVTSSPPTQGHFVGYEGLPSDWYLRLVGEGARMLRGERPITVDIPIAPRIRPADSDTLQGRHGVLHP
jgi:hypothetical protein